MTGIQQLLDWHAGHLGQVEYSESSPHRLDWETTADLLTPTDCSGDAIRTYRHFCGVNTGATYTGNLWNHGQLITTNLSAAADGHSMLPGDLVLYHWRGWSVTSWDPFNHVNVYAGSGVVYNHGGMGKGPVKQSLRDNVSRAAAVRVIRLVPATVPPAPTPAPHPSGNPMHGYAVPYLIARSTGDYFGLVTGPNQSHGGAYSSERGYIELIQKFLNWKYKAGLTVDGYYRAEEAAAVKRFQQAYMPGTQFYGQVWYDDWAKMASLT